MHGEPTLDNLEHSGGPKDSYFIGKLKRNPLMISELIHRTIIDNRDSIVNFIINKSTKSKRITIISKFPDKIGYVMTDDASYDADHLLVILEVDRKRSEIYLITAYPVTRKHAKKKHK